MRKSGPAYYEPFDIIISLYSCTFTYISQSLVLNNQIKIKKQKKQKLIN